MNRMVSKFAVSLGTARRCVLWAAPIKPDWIEGDCYNFPVVQQDERDLNDYFKLWVHT
jgi:hypothetical protein